MQVKVELQAYLEQYSPNGNPVFDYSVPEGATVDKLVRQLEIPDELASVIIVNQDNADPDRVLAEGDKVTLIPPLAGG
ncbi:MAG: MoaD/ThiS family protein [Chloroflexi bacterium]|nr:MoaD/ThiS family protein [Chloroflexota bacterium]